MLEQRGALLGFNLQGGGDVLPTGKALLLQIRRGLPAVVPAELWNPISSIYSPRGPGDPYPAWHAAADTQRIWSGHIIP